MDDKLKQNHLARYGDGFAAVHAAVVAVFVVVVVAVVVFTRCARKFTCLLASRSRHKRHCK